MQSADPLCISYAWASVCPAMYVCCMLTRKAGAYTGTPRDAQAQFCGYGSVNWCLAENEENGGQLGLVARGGLCITR